MNEYVRSPIQIEFPYTHSTGPVIGVALAALREGRILGARCPACDAVAAPAREWCDRCGGSTADLVEVGPGGTVTVAAPVHAATGIAPIDGEFSWALVRLDGASTDLVHVVRGRVAAGERVRPVWRAERRGAITDIECFEPGEPSEPASVGALPDPIKIFERRVSLPFTLSAGAALSRFFDDIRKRRQIHGVRCTSCRLVLCPPRVACPRCWADTEGWIPLPDRGIVRTFVIVNVPFYGQEMPLPYVLAHIRLDGADTTFLHILGTIAPEDVRLGMTVEAVWREERTGFLNDDVRYFRPAD